MKYVVSTVVALAFVPSVALAVVPPYFENFDAETTCSDACGTACPLSSGWVNDTVGDGMDWIVNSGGTSSSPTGPDADHTTGMGNYLYTETTGVCTGLSAHLVSPDFDLTGGNATQMEFWYHLHGATMGTLHVDIDPDGGGDGPWAVDVIPSLTDNVNTWQMMTVDLTAYVGSTINVRFRGMTGTSFTSDMAIDDVRLYDLWADDIGVTSIDEPVNGCSLSATQAVTITVSNFGSNPQTGFDVSYTLDGGTPVVETFTGTLAAGSSTPFTFATTADLSGAGPFDIDARTLLATDQSMANDTAPTRTVMVLGNDVSTFPNINDFEAGPGDWFAHGTPANSWQLGTPAKVTINSAASGVNAWVSGGLSGQYTNNEDAYVETLCGYDFSALSFPTVRLRAWWSTETGFDQANLQVSTDDGATWNVVGAFDDPNNWYNDVTPGWTGESGGYLTAVHELQAYAGMPSVKFRMWFGTDGSVLSNGFAFDDFEIFENLPELNIADTSPPGAISSLAPGLANVHVQSLRMDANGNIGTDIDSITVTRTGSLMDADIALVKLWLDNGDTSFSPLTDTTIATANFTGGLANFTGLMTMLSLAPLVPQWVHITYDLAPTATPGGTFGSSINSSTDIVPIAAIPVNFAVEPLSGPVLSVLQVVDTLPFTDDYDDPTISNRTTLVSEGALYPTASAPGPFVDPSPSPSPNPGFVELSGQVDDGAGGFITPVSPPLMAALSSPFGGAASALEYWFDLSAFNINDHLLWLRFSWNNANMNDHDLNNVFISTDAATTWAASAYRWDFTSPVAPGWHDETVDLSTPLLFSGTDYSATTVLRFQAFGLNGFGDDGLTIDNIWIGIPQYAYIERNPGTGLPSGTIDGVYGMGTGPITLDYTLTNDAHLPLTLGDITVSGTSGLNNLVVAPTTLPGLMNPGDSTSFSVSFEATDENFSFLLEFPTDDPRAMGGVYALTVIGEHAPQIAVQRPAGVNIANGATDDQGQHFAGETRALTYTIVNDGTEPLLLTDMPDLVSIVNGNNVDATVAVQPELGEVPPAGSVTFEVSYSVIAEDDFQFDIMIGNNVSGQDPYTVTVAGTAAVGAPDAGVEPDAGMMGPDAGPGDVDAGTIDPPGDDGCSCDVGHRPTPGPSPFLVFVLAAFVGLYRQRDRLFASRSR